MTPAHFRLVQRRAVANIFQSTDSGGSFTTNQYQLMFKAVLQASTKYGKVQLLGESLAVRHLAAMSTVVRLGKNLWYCTDSR